jgi:lysophospholipase L1-like esterase
VRWQLVAQTGARSEDVLQMLSERNLRRADVGVVLAGVNDISKQVSLRKALRTRDAIAALMKERAGVKHVVFSALPEMEKFPALPQPLAWYAGQHARYYNDAQARWLAGRDAVSHAPMEGVMDPSLMAGDGFHPGPRLYAKVAERLAVHIIQEVLPRLRKGKGAA